MKKIVCLMLVCMMTLCAASALAAGKLSVVQENFHYVTSYWNYGYAYAKVENIGDRPIMINAGVLEIYDAEGEVITSSDYMYTHATYLQPGEYTYVKMYDEIEAGQPVPDDYMLTITGKSSVDKTALHLPVTTKLDLNVTEGWWTYNYMYATITNNTADTLYDVEVVMALLDAEGTILYVDSYDFYTTVGIEPGSSVTVRKDIDSGFIEYFEAKELIPATVDAQAYALIEKE